MYGCESWTIKAKLSTKELMLLNCGVGEDSFFFFEKTLESLLDCNEIQPVHPEGNWSWIFIRRTDSEAETPVLWPPDAKNWLIWKDPDAGKDWRRKEKGTTENEMVGWRHRLNGHESERPGALQSVGSQRVGHNWAAELNWAEEPWWRYKVRLLF